MSTWVKIRERSMAGDAVAFFVDTYHKDFGRLSQKTELQANPKNRNTHNLAKDNTTHHLSALRIRGRKPACSTWQRSCTLLSRLKS